MAGGGNWTSPFFGPELNRCCFPLSQAFLHSLRFLLSLNKFCLDQHITKVGGLGSFITKYELIELGWSQAAQLGIHFFLPQHTVRDGAG